MPDSPFDDDFDELREAAGASLETTQRYAQKRQRWEENVLKRILSIGGKGQLARKLANHHYERTKEFRLTFEDFKRECPEFPMFLGFEKPAFAALEKAERQLLNMRKAGKNALVDLFYVNHDALPVEYQECHQGVVFEWLHHGSAYKLIHNQTLITVAYPWTRTTISLPDNYGPLYIEDLDCYLHSIGWTANAR